MAKELSQLEVVYNFLVSGNQELYRAKQIYETMPKATKERFKGGINDISKCLTKLKSQGRVENGEIYYDDSQPRLTWRAVIKSEKTGKTDETSTNQPVVDAAAETVEDEPVKVYQTEAEREYFDGFAYPKDSTNSFESLIEEAQDTAILSVSNVFNGLIEQLYSFAAVKHDYDVEPLIDGLLEVSDLLNERVAVKNIIPVIEFLRGLK